MRTLIALLAALAAGSAFAAPGIPNDLATLFKSTGKLPDRIIPYEGHELAARLEPRHEAVAILYKVPETLDRAALMRALLLDARGFGPEFTLDRDGVGEHYVMRRSGLLVENAWVTVMPSDPGFVALAVKLPARNDLVDAPAAHEHLVYMGDGLQRVTRTRAPDGTTRNATPRFESFTTVTLTPERAAAGTLETIPLTRGSFPDQVKVDAQGRVWYTQPSDNLLSHYDPSTRVFGHFAVGALPDGLGIDRAGRLWFGEYGAARLALYDPATSAYERFEPDYPDSKPAIPYEDRQGIIWVTDHEQNKIGRFDPATKVFTHVPVASAGAWAVDLVETADDEHIWVTECYANKIGKLNKTTRAYTEVTLPTSSCPAFFAPVGHDLYVSLWQTGSFLHLDTLTGAITEFKVTGDSGFGPIARLGDGSLAIGSLGSGKAYKFDPRTRTLTYVEGIGRLKDGLTVAPDGVTVWITDTARSIYKVTF